MINSQLKKKEILESLGLDYLIDLHFNKKFTQLNHLEFEDKILLGKLNAKKILIGRDFQYGNQRKGNIETLRIFCEKNNIKVISLTRDYNLINDLHIFRSQNRLGSKGIKKVNFIKKINLFSNLFKNF